MPGVGSPIVRPRFDPRPIRPAEKREVEIASCELADLGHGGAALTLVRLNLVGDEDDLRNHRHVRDAKGMDGDRFQHILVLNPELIVRDAGGAWSVQDDGVELVVGSGSDAGFAGLAKLLFGRKMAKEVVDPGSEFDARGIDIPVRGQGDRFVSDALDVLLQRDWPRLHFTLYHGQVAGNLVRHRSHSRRWQTASRRVLSDCRDGKDGGLCGVARFAGDRMPRMDVLSAFWTPLCAVGSHGERGPNAQICVSVFGASIVPDRPRLLVNLSKTNYTCDLVRESGTLSVTPLGKEQLPLLSALGLHSGRDTDKLAGLDLELTDNDDPVFPGGIGYVAGEVLEAFDLGDSKAYLMAVRERETWRDASPMRWHDARKVVGEEFLSRWAEKSQREQEAARKVMRWA